MLGLRWYARSVDRGHQLEQLAQYLPHDPIPALYSVKGFKIPFNPVRTWIFDSTQASDPKHAFHAVLLHASGQPAVAFRDQLRASEKSAPNAIKGTLRMQGRDLVCYRLGRWKAEKGSSEAPLPPGAEVPAESSAGSQAGDQETSDSAGDVAFGLEKFLEAGATVAIVELSREGSGELLLALLLMNGNDLKIGQF